MRNSRYPAVLTVVVLLLAACTNAPASSPSTAASASGGPGASGGTDQIKEGGTFVVAIPGDIDNLDMALISDSNSSYVGNQVMQGLVGLAPGSVDKIDPVLAESWEASADGLSYTFKLRSGIKFHDGTDFNADAVVYNYNRWLNLPAELQALAYYFGAVFGFGSTSNITSVEAVDASTVKFTLKQPQSNFLLAQTVASFFLSSPDALKKFDADNPDIKKNKYMQESGMVGTGPFKFKEWVAGDHVTVVKNADYWDTANVAHVDEIVFKEYSDQTAEFNALETGSEVDFAQTIAPIDAQSAKDAGTLEIIDRGDSCNIGYLGLNQAKPPLDNPKIREAIAYALNKQAYVDAFYAGAAVVADNWMPPATQFYKALSLPTYDLEKAKAALTASGVSNPTIDFWYPSNVARPYMPDPKGLFEAIQTDLEAAGFTVTPHTATWSPDYLDAEEVGKYQAFLLGWTCDWAGPDNFLNTFFGFKEGKPNPEFGYNNKQVDDWMLEALTLPDVAQQEDLWTKVQDQLAKDLPTIPLLHSTPPAAAQKYVKGVVGSGALNEYFNTVWLDK